MIHALLAITIINLLVAFKDFKSIAAPPVLFNLGFLLCFLGAELYSTEWGLDAFHLNTFLTFAVGISLFTITSLIVKKKKGNKRNTTNLNENIVIIPNNILIICIIFLLSANYIHFRVLQQITGFSDFASVAAAVDYMKKFDETETFSLPFYIRFINKITLTLSFVFAYFGGIAFFNRNTKKTTKILYIIILLISIGGPLLQGGRAGSIRIILVILFMYYYIANERNQWNFKIPKKILITILGLGFLILAFWGNISSLLGRSTLDDIDFDVKYYAAIYCGAQVKNLDLYLNESASINQSEITGYATFSSIYAKLMPSKIDMKNVLSFQNYNGYSLGNVYTCFYFYIYDFGYAGIILISIFAYFITKVWNKIRYYNGKNKFIYICIYAMFCYPLFFSFFSEFFFTTVLTVDFISRLIFWMLEYKLIVKLFSKKSTIQNGIVHKQA